MTHRYFILNDYCFLTITGKNSEAYLQGQLTNDVRQLSETRAQPTLLCSLKGRIIASMLLFKRTNPTLILPKNLIDNVQKTLNKSALFSKVAFEENTDLCLIGLELSPSTSWPKPLPKAPFEGITFDGAQIIRLNETLFYLIIERNQLKYWQDELNKYAKHSSEEIWNACRLSSNMLEISAATSDLFLPHRLNLHQRNYISFNKGCYRGQEIIARMHYKATLKHEVIFITVNLDKNSPKPGDKVYSADGSTELGEVVDIAVLSPSQLILGLSVLIDRPQHFIFKSGESTSP